MMQHDVTSKHVQKIRPKTGVGWDFFFFSFFARYFSKWDKKGKQRDESNIFDDNKMITAIKDAKTIQVVSFFCAYGLSLYVFSLFPFKSYTKIQNMLHL